MALTTALVVSAAAGAYGAYSSKRAGDKMISLGRTQSDRQGYFAGQLVDLMNNPSKIFDDPGYKELFDQGTQAVNRSNALKGFTGSGNAAIALQSYGQGFASKYLNDQKALLASLSGAQFNPAAAYGGAQSANNDSFAQLGSTLASLGYSFGGGGGAGSGGGGGVGLGSGSGSWGAASTGGGMTTPSGYIVNTPGG